MQLNYTDQLAGLCNNLHTLELICQKYYWPDLNWNILKCVNIYNICYYIKPVRYKLYNSLNFLLLSQRFFTNLIIDFIINMSLCKYQKMVYDFIFLLICQFTKIV